jgi:DNA-directed RNA polymerase subunit K/omega
MPIQPIELKALDIHANNIYEAIVVLSRRARQINEEIKIQLNEKLDQFSTRSDSDEEVELNPEQQRISIEFEKMEKPTQGALADLLGEKLTYVYKEE